MTPREPGPRQAAAHAVERAWSLRQADPVAAREQAARARAALPPDAADLRARLALAEAELAWLDGRHDASERLALAAERDWGPGCDPAGRADVALLRAHLSLDRGDMATALAQLTQAEHLACEACDHGRQQFAQGLGAYWSLSIDPASTAARWGSTLQALRGVADPAVAMVVEAYTATVAGRRGDLSSSMLGFARAYQHALAAGRHRFAIAMATNVASDFGNRGQFDEAMRWIEQALVLARPTGWPVSTGQTLRTMGSLLFQMGRLDGARATYEEALDALAPMPMSRNAQMALLGLAEVRMAQGAPGEAEALYRTLEQQARLQARHEMLGSVLYLRAQALGAAGHPVAALQCAREALDMFRTQGAALHEIEALQVLASLHDDDAPRARTYLLEALARGRALASWVPRAQLLVRLAEVHLHLGDAAAAWPLLQQAQAIRRAQAERHEQERVALMEAAQTLARERAAAEAMRREAQRRQHEAGLMAHANRVLAGLGRLGRRLLLETTRAGVAARLAADAPRLLPLAAIVLLSAGAPVPPAPAGAARLVRRLRMHDLDQGVLVATLLGPGSAAERQLLRTLAAWVALACAHAAALEELRQARRRLLAARTDADHARRRLDEAVQQRRRFAAFISHDLRSPLASLQGLLDTLRQPPTGLRADEQLRFARSARELAAQLQRMIGELGALAGLQGGVIEPRPVALDLPELVNRVFARLELEAARRGLRLELWREADVPPAQADAGMVERVLANLVDNAVRHAAPGGHVRVELASDGASVRVAVLNDGDAVAAERRPGLFHAPVPGPMQRRSAGLGLLGVQRLVALHGATVRSPSRPGWAAAFEFSLPALAARPRGGDARAAAAALSAAHTESPATVGGR